MRFPVSSKIIAIESQYVDGEDTGTVLEKQITCDRGWFLFGDLCYGTGSRGIGKVSWQKASGRCKDDGGQLATIYSQEQLDFLRAFILMDVRSSMWINISDTVDDSIYKRVDARRVDYINWEPKQPSGFLIQDEKKKCAEMVFLPYRSGGSSGTWNDLNCNRQLEFICQKRTNRQIRKNNDPRFCSPRIGGWRHRTSCYHIVDEELSWSEAEHHCVEQYHGHLVTIKDFTDRIFLEYILRNYSKDMWIGIKIKDEVQQQWSSGWFVTYTQWAKDKGDLNEGTCAIRTVHDEWTIIPCKFYETFICEISTVTPPTLTSPVGLTCPEEQTDWRDLGGEFCYFFDTTRRITFSEANFRCMRQGGTLLSIHSRLELDVLQQFIIYTKWLYWIGFYRHKQQDENFAWADGTPVDFTFWAANEPNSRTEQCTEMRTDTMEWNDRTCSNIRGYICSVKKVPLNRTIGNEITPFECGSSFSINSLIGILVCVLVVAVLLGIIVYYLRPNGGDQKQSRKLSGVFSEHTEKPIYRTATEVVVKGNI